MNPKTTAPVDQNYFVQKGETTDAYNTRIADYRASKTPTAPQITAGTIPASVMASGEQTPALQMPPMQPLPNDVPAVRAAGQSFLDFERQQAEAQAAQTQAPITASEQNIRNMFGLLSQEGQTRTALEERAGIPKSNQQLLDIQNRITKQIAELDQFDLDNINTQEQMRVDSSRRDITKGTFNAMTAEMNIQQSVRRANMVAQTRATIAAGEALRDNIELATEQVNKALEAIYEPVRMGLQMEQFFLERNDKRFDAAQQRLAEVRKMEIQRENDVIDRAQSMVDAAVSSGGASPDEIQRLVALSNDPTAQKNLAMSIVSRTNASDRALEREAKFSQIEASRAAIAAKNATTTEGKPLTQSQYAALNFGTRMAEANQVINDIGSKFTSNWMYVSSRLPNALKTPDQQKFEQAQRSFINAVLRRESGAQISDQEFQSAALQYFPQPGDKTENLIQKQRDRELVIRNFYSEAGQDTTPQDMALGDPLGLGVGSAPAANPLGL